MSIRDKTDILRRAMEKHAETHPDYFTESRNAASNRLARELHTIRNRQNNKKAQPAIDAFRKSLGLSGGSRKTRKFRKSTKSKKSKNRGLV